MNKIIKKEIMFLFKRLDFCVERLNARILPSQKERIFKNADLFKELTPGNLKGELTKKDLKRMIKRLENLYHNTRMLSNEAFTVYLSMMVMGAETSAGIRLQDQDADMHIKFNPDVFNKRL
jgi:hypothetical protein